jgi:hypothetical protein
MDKRAAGENSTRAGNIFESDLNGIEGKPRSNRGAATAARITATATQELLQ